MQKKHILLVLLSVALAALPVIVHAAASSAHRASLQAARKAARDALQRLDPAGAVKVLWPAHRATPAALLGLRIKSLGQPPQDQAREFISKHRALLLGPGSTLQLKDMQRTKNRQVVRFEQIFAGLKVEGASVSVQLDHQGIIRSISSTAAHISKLNTTPQVTAKAAIQAALQGISSVGATGAPSRTRLVILAEGAARLIYKVTLPLSQDPRVRMHLVDAHTGEYLGWRRGAIIEKDHLHPDHLRQNNRGGAR